MKFRIATVKRVMKQATKLPITDGAACFLALKAEEWIIQKTQEAEKLRKEKNDLRKMQGLRETKKIDEELMSEVLSEK